jgi:hypothetical protein
MSLMRTNQTSLQADPQQGSSATAATTRSPPRREPLTRENAGDRVRAFQGDTTSDPCNSRRTSLYATLRRSISPVPVESVESTGPRDMSLLGSGSGSGVLCSRSVRVRILARCARSVVSSAGQRNTRLIGEALLSSIGRCCGGPVLGGRQGDDLGDARGGRAGKADRQAFGAAGLVAAEVHR